MARKKVVLVIVEGLSDEDALSIVFTKFYERYSKNVLVKVMHGDITTEWSNCSQNIREKITKVVKQHAAVNKFEKENYEQIIHIVDTDGAFIDEIYVVEDCNLEEICYSTSNITCKNKQQILDRNNLKSNNLLTLVSIKKIWGIIPYSVYYMSCNLDHVLYDLQNSSDIQKEYNAHQFAKQYKDNLKGFIEFISKSTFTVNGSYSETWDFIQKDINSLNRHTNLQLCFKE